MKIGKRNTKNKIPPRILKAKSKRKTPITSKSIPPLQATQDKQNKTQRHRLNKDGLPNAFPGNKPLSPKRERLVQEYMVDYNIWRAAKRAKYKTGKNSTYIYTLLKEPEVQARIGWLQSQRSRRLEITVDRVVEELASIAFFNVRDLYDDEGNYKHVTSLTRQQAAAITGLDTVELKSKGQAGDIIRKIRFAGKESALYKLGQHLGVFGKDATKGTSDPTMYAMREKRQSMKALSQKELSAYAALLEKMAANNPQETTAGDPAKETTNPPGQFVPRIVGRE